MTRNLQCNEMHTIHNEKMTSEAVSTTGLAFVASPLVLNTKKVIVTEHLQCNELKHGLHNVDHAEGISL